MALSQSLGLAFLVCLLQIASSANVDKGGIVSEGLGKLVMSHILYRHGDRTPTQFTPTDPYYHLSDWQVGAGELTPVGMAQHQKLGQWFRGRYDEDFLPKTYSPNNIYVRSTDKNRAIASALCNLAGLYPPAGDEIWNKTIHWQPIPVHNVPASDDFLLGSVVPSCPIYEQALAKAFASQDVEQVISDYRSQIDYSLKNAGESLTLSNVDLIFAIALIRDELLIESIYKKQLPPWTKSIYPSDWIDRVAMLWFTLSSSTQQMAKLTMGYLLKEILDRSTSKVNGTLSPDLSVFVYSAHDVNIVNVLQGLGVFDNKYVEYTAALLFEVRIYENVPYMEIFYKRSVDTKTPEPMFIRNCGYSCPLDKMYEVYDNILPKYDFNTECNLNK